MTKQCAWFLLAALLWVAPALAQVERATVKINGMI